MKKIGLLTFIIVAVAFFSTAFHSRDIVAYTSLYEERLTEFRQAQLQLLETIAKSDVHSPAGIQSIQDAINNCRSYLKRVDFWFRYLEPTMYHQVNGPLPVEWETEVFEKFEKPYKREGAGLSLAAQYSEEENVNRDSLEHLVQGAVRAMDTYGADSITVNLASYHHFFLCNRLFLLNLAAIYTTGFECPDSTRIIPELRNMLESTKEIYQSFNAAFPDTPLPDGYLQTFEKAVIFVRDQPVNFSDFDHFTFIRDFVNHLFALNQQAISRYKVVTRSFVDYTLNKSPTSIFSKDLYRGQNARGVFLRVNDERVLAEIDHLGKLLFYDPILSGNNKRSCASCHRPTEYFTDTAIATPVQFNQRDLLPRNTPTLINVGYNHLVMLDGLHISLQNQTRAVITSPIEMGSAEQDMVKKVMSCPDYRKAFEKLLQYTPGQTEVTMEHIASAITLYYSKFSKYYSAFDDAMNYKNTLPMQAVKGFNLFMGRAQCATCHFVPQFNGVKPPYVSSEFEVLGVPEDKDFHQLSDDKGRYAVNPAPEMMNAFRTGTVRNADHTEPYMHNGVFKTMDDVIAFYDAGGGRGKGLHVENQTLEPDSLHLSAADKEALTAFIHSLNERILFEDPPRELPHSKIGALNSRKVGGEY